MPHERQDDVQQLRNTMRDLVALSTLPAVWAGYAPQGIVGSLADVLLSTLSLDIVFVRTGDIEVVRGKGLTAEHIPLIASALNPWLTASDPPSILIHPLNDGKLRVAVSRFGHSVSEGLVIACSRRPDFPGESDRLLLGVGANQTAIVLQRKRAERALAEERQRLRVTLSSIGDAVIATDAQGRVTFMNGVAESLTGWPLADAEGRPLPEVFQIVNEHTREPGANPALRPLTEGVTVGLANHTVLIARDGTERPIDDSAAPIRDGRDAPTGAVLVFRDVTERKRADQERHADEERLRTALAATRMVAWEWTPADRKLRVSESAAEVFGLAAGVGLTGIDQGLALVHPDDVEAYQATFRDAIERRVSYHIHYRLVRPSDGRVIWIEERGNTVFDQPGGGVRLFGVAADVTERKRAEAEAAQLAEKLRLALDAGDLGTWEWNPATDEMTVSDRAAEMYGTTPGVPHRREEGRRMIHPDDRERARETAARSVAERTDYDIEYRLAERPTWVAAHGRGLYDPAGNLVRVHGVVQDVTERKRAEEELREADRKKDDFIALLAHELRNPLAPIRNGLQALKLSATEAAPDWAIGMMDRQLTHMVRLIDDLLDVSRINRHKMELRRERVHLAEVIASAVETAQPAIDAAGHELTVTLPSKPIDLDADLTRLAQVFSNLLTNSAKYTHRGGQVWLTAALEGERVSVSVRDTGIGIPEAELPTIFDMFSQVDRSIERTTGGLGIGLALVKGLTEMHGGKVSVASEGSGTTFTVTLPVLAGRAGSPVATEPTPPPGKGLRILVVDDSRDGAISLSRLLEMLGHDVRTAFDGYAAIETTREYRPNVILMDVGMPGLNGYETTRRIRDQDWGAAITIIALTGWGQEGDRKLSREAGCDGHLVKPVDLSDLEKLLDELSSQR